MKRRSMLPVLALCAVAAAAAPGGAAAVAIDGIAATVGSAAILKSDVEAELRRNPRLKDFTAARNALIERQLILKAAAESKLTMQDWVVEDRVRSIVEEAFGGDRNKLVEALAKERTPFSEWKRRIRDDLVVNAMRWSVVEKNVRASPAAMRREYESNKDAYRAQGKVSVTAIVLRPEDAGKRGDVAAALKKEPFEDVAKRYSGGSAAVWKDIVPSEKFRPEVCAEIAKTPVGAVSRWTELDGWLFLVRKDAEAPAKPRAFAEAYADIEAKVRAAESKRLYSAWMECLKSETHIHVYDREKSR